MCWNYLCSEQKENWHKIRLFFLALKSLQHCFLRLIFFDFINTAGFSKAIRLHHWLTDLLLHLILFSTFRYTVSGIDSAMIAKVYKFKILHYFAHWNKIQSTSPRIWFFLITSYVEKNWIFTLKMRWYLGLK